jgi:HEAT repeat protein
MNLIWSSDDAERTSGKAKLIEMGKRSVPALVALLEDLVRNPGPRYVLGREAEGAAIRERFFSLPAEKQTLEEAKKLLSFSIESRLRLDLYEMLGKLRAEEAIPLLIRILEHEERHNMLDLMEPFMKALAEIGPPAVPRLIESIERAEATAAQSTTFESAPDLTETQRAQVVEQDANTIRVRAILVLEAIGDPRAIAILERLHEATTNPFVSKRTIEVISNIRKKNDK